MRSTSKLILGFCAVLGVLVALSSELLAVIGRPLTPVSVAGVARRSVRRSVYY